jgi:hypothetical protein
MWTNDRARICAFLTALATVSACATTLPAVPGEPTSVFFSEAGADQKVGRSMKDSAQRCRERLTELRSSASNYRLTATVLSLLTGSIGVLAGTASASLFNSSPGANNSNPGAAQALSVTAAIAAGLSAVITPVLRPDAREQAYLSAYFRWQTANVRLRSLYTSEPLAAVTDKPEGPAIGNHTRWASSERFQQAWSAMADDLDVCASTSFR